MDAVFYASNYGKLGSANTWTADNTFNVIKAQHCDAATSAGVHIGNATHQDVAIFGAGGGQGATFYGQINGTSLSLSAGITCTTLTTSGNATIGGSYLTLGGRDAIYQTAAFTNVYGGSTSTSFTSSNGADIWLRLTPGTPGTPSAGQVLIGGGEIKAGAGITCTTLTASDTTTAGPGSGALVCSGGGYFAKAIYAVADASAVNYYGNSGITFRDQGSGTATYLDLAFGSASHGSYNIRSSNAATVRFSISATGVVAVTSTTASTSTTTGCATFGGGIGVAGGGYFGADIVGPKVRLTPEGGIATLVVADEAISVGHICAIIQGGTANRVKRCPISGNENDMPVGVAYTAAAAAGDSFWMVVSGRVGVLPDTGVTAAQGYILYTSATTAGLAAQAATAPAAATHFKEIGHFINTGSGAGVITDAIVHFN